jgi:hypothetical protein
VPANADIGVQALGKAIAAGPSKVLPANGSDHRPVEARISW